LALRIVTYIAPISWFFDRLTYPG